MYRKTVILVISLIVTAAEIIIHTDSCADMNKRYTLAVLNMEAYGISRQEARTVSDSLRSAISRVIEEKNVPYILLKPEEMSTILKLFESTDTGRISDTDAVEFGKMLDVERVALGSVGLAGKTYSLAVRIVDVETSLIVASADAQHKGLFDDALGVIIPGAVQTLFKEKPGDSSLIGNIFPWTRDLRGCGLSVLDLDVKGVSREDGKILSDKLLSTISDLMGNNNDMYILLERTQMDKILKLLELHRIFPGSESSAVEFGKIFPVKNIVVGSVELDGETYIIKVRLMDVETGKSVRSAEKQYRGPIDDVLVTVIPGTGKELFSKNWR